MHFNDPPGNNLMEFEESKFNETNAEDMPSKYNRNDNNNNNLPSFNFKDENIEITNILSSFTQQKTPKLIKNNYDQSNNNNSPPIINLIMENYRIRLTERISNCNSMKNDKNENNENQITPILYLTPHIPQNKRHVHFYPQKNDIVPRNATVFDFNAAMLEFNERITERQEMAIAYAEMLCSDISSTSSHLSPSIKYSSQRSAARNAFDRTPIPKNSKPTFPIKQNSKKKIKVYHSNFSDCSKELAFQNNQIYGLNEALSITKVNVPNKMTSQLINHPIQNQKRQNIRKNPSLSKPFYHINSNGNNFERGGSVMRKKQYHEPLQTINNGVDWSFSKNK